MIYVVLYGYFDDYELVGASVDREKAKELKRTYCEAPNANLSKNHRYAHTAIIPCEDGKRP